MVRSVDDGLNVAADSEAGIGAAVSVPAFVYDCVRYRTFVHANA